MKYEVGYLVINPVGKKGVIEKTNDTPERPHYWVQLESGKSLWYQEDELTLQPVQAENERLRAVIADVKRVATGLYERAPTEGATELLFYLSVMQREFDLALAESEE